MNFDTIKQMIASCYHLFYLLLCTVKKMNCCTFLQICKYHYFIVAYCCRIDYNEIGNCCFIKLYKGFHYKKYSEFMVFGMLLKRISIMTIVLLIMMVLVSSGCVAYLDNSAVEKDATYSEEKDYDIDLKAEFNKEKNCVDLVVTNNTKTLTIYPNDHEYYFYKENDGKWESINWFASAHFSNTPPAVSPVEGHNVYHRSIAAYPCTNDNNNNIAVAQKTQYLQPGNYKISVNIEVLDPTEYFELKDNEGEVATYPNYKGNKVDVREVAYFTVE